MYLKNPGSTTVTLKMYCLGPVRIFVTLMSRGADNCMVPFAILSVDSQIKFIDWNYTTFDSVNGVHCFIFFISVSCSITCQVMHVPTKQTYGRLYRQITVFQVNQ